MIGITKFHRKSNLIINKKTCVLCGHVPFKWTRSCSESDCQVTSTLHLCLIDHILRPLSLSKSMVIDIFNQYPHIG